MTDSAAALIDRPPGQRVRRCLLSAALAAFALCGATSVARAEAVPQLALDYHVFAGGLHVLSYEAVVGLDPGAYKANVRARTNGWIDRLFKFSLEAEVAGVTGAAGLMPKSFRVANRWHENPERWVEITYPEGAAPETRAEPPAAEDDRDPVPEALRLGTLDPISAVLAVVSEVAESGRCELEVPIFDGRRRYNLLTRHLGETELKPSDVAPFGGPATRCGIAFEMLGGAWKKKSRRWKDAGRPEIEVFVARVLPGVPLVPVRVHAKNNFGALRIHLIAARPVTSVTQSAR
jgi:hypothetical protein